MLVAPLFVLALQLFSEALQILYAIQPYKPIAVRKTVIFICFFACFLERPPGAPYANSYNFDYKAIVCFSDMNSVHMRLFYSVSRRECEKARETECEEIPIEYDKLCLRALANVREKQRSLWSLHKRNSFHLEPAEMRVKGGTGELQKYWRETLLLCGGSCFPKSFYTLKTWCLVIFSFH